MDFWLSDDERELQAGIRNFVSGRFPLDDIAAREETDEVIDLGLWRELGDLGVFSLRLDGFDNRATAVAFEELGRGLVPGPLVATHLAAGLVDGAGDGSTVVSMFEPSRSGPTLVEHARQASALLSLSDDGARLVDPGMLDLRRVERPLDPLSPVWTTTVLDPDGRRLDLGTDGIGDTGGSEDDRPGADASVDELRRVGTVLTAALQVGVAAAALEMANEYAKQREQFGRPIGSFQAVKHLLAEMFVVTDVARSAVWAAACALDGASDDDPGRAASVAKTMGGEAALFCGKTGIQVHGGMGFTWEVHAQRCWKRAVVLDASFGDSAHHAGRVADLLGAGPGS